MPRILWEAETMCVLWGKGESADFWGEEDWISPKNEGRMLEAWCLAKGELVHMEQAWWPSQETKIRYRKLVFNKKKQTFFFFVDSDLLSDRE